MVAVSGSGGVQATVGSPGTVVPASGVVLPSDGVRVLSGGVVGGAVTVAVTVGCLLLAVLYPIIVKEARIAPQRAAQAGKKTAAVVKRPLRTLCSSPSVIAAYIGSGLQLFVGGTVIVWMPSYLNRYYDMAPDKAGGVAAMTQKRQNVAPQQAFR